MAQRVHNRRTDPDYDDFKKRLGERINQLRVEMNLNQDDFAQKVNIHRSHISKLENAEIAPNLLTLFKLAKALNMKVSELLEL